MTVRRGRFAPQARDRTAMALSEPVVCPVLVDRDEHGQALDALQEKPVGGAGQSLNGA